jgi:hypothetical protein
MAALDPDRSYSVKVQSVLWSTYPRGDGGGIDLSMPTERDRQRLTWGHTHMTQPLRIQFGPIVLNATIDLFEGGANL